MEVSVVSRGRCFYPPTHACHSAAGDKEMQDAEAEEQPMPTPESVSDMRSPTRAP